MSVFNYYELKLKLRDMPMLATNPSSCDVLKDHVINKSRKMMAEANKGQKKVLKHLQKFVGEEITIESEKEQLMGTIRSQQELLGISEDIPEEIDDIIKYSKELEERMSDKFEAEDLYKSTVFLRNEEGKVCISGHVILGNIKEICKIISNSQKKEDKTIFKSKTQVSESLAMTCKSVLSLIPADRDIMRHPNGERNLCVRPIRFTDKTTFQQTVALAASEQLPPGTEFTTVLRICKGTPLDNIDTLKYLFSFGKSLGLGSWRSSNSMGTYDFQIKKLDDFKEPVQEGWE